MALLPVLVTDWWSKNCLETSSRFPRRTPRSAHDVSLQCGDRRQRIPEGGRSGFVELGCGGAFTTGHCHAVLQAFNGVARILRFFMAMNRPSPP